MISKKKYEKLLDECNSYKWTLEMILELEAWPPELHIRVIKMWATKVLAGGYPT